MHKERYEYYKNKHICVRCGSNDADKNHVLCLQCRMKQNKYHQNYYNENKNEYLKKQRDRKKQQYNNLKRNGMCVCCRKRKAKDNQVRCDWCAKRENERKRNKYLLNIYATVSIEKIRV